MMSYLQFFAWSATGHDDRSDVANFLTRIKPQIIEYISPEEWYPGNSIADILYEYAENNDCELRLLMSCYNKWNNLAMQPPRKNATYEDNPTLIFNYVLTNYYNDHHVKYNFAKGNNIHECDPTDRNEKIKYNVISMTNRVHRFRSEMIDRFAEYGIINDNNCIIWQNNGHMEYDYKYFKPAPIIREQFLDSRGIFNSFELPADYALSWFAAVSESSTDIITITEKTATPILFMKPFLVLGDRGYHKFLESIGFKLFEEFIDYSFDLEINESRRIELFAQQIHKISNFSKEQIIEFNNIIKDKLIHNKQNMFKLFYGNQFKPKYVTGWERVKPSPDIIYHKEAGSQLNWYQHVVRRGWYDSI